MKLPKKNLNIIKKAIRHLQCRPQGDADDTGLVDRRLGDGWNFAYADANMMPERRSDAVLHLLDQLEDREPRCCGCVSGSAAKSPRPSRNWRMPRLTRERVRQIEREALGKLHVMLEDE